MSSLSRFRIASLVATLVAGGALAGCGAPASQPASGPAPSPAAAGDGAGGVAEGAGGDDAAGNDAAEPAPRAAVELQVLDYDAIQKLIAGHRGKIVVLDAWSTSCPPCVKEFPGLVALHRKYGPDKVACVSVSFDNEGLDSIDEIREPVLGFLRQQGATFDNVLSSEEAEVLYRKFELTAVPAVFVYDRAGKLRHRFDNSDGKEFTYEDIGRLVAEMSAERAPSTTD